MSMRRKANVSLILLTIAFFAIIITRAIVGDHPILSALLFIVEAGMVGALADWFAVTALFRHPLGLRFIPHTAIIPRNKKKLIDGVVMLVEEQLLDRKLIEQKLEAVNIVQSVITSIGTLPIRHIKDKQIKHIIVKLAGLLITDKNAVKLERLLESFLNNAQLAKWLVSLYELAKKNKWDSAVINKVLNVLHKKLSEKEVLQAFNEMLISETEHKVEKDFFSKLLFKAAQAINAVNIDDAAEIIHRDLINLVEGLKDKDHPVRLMLDSQLASLAHDLKTKDDIDAVLRVWLVNLVAEIKLQSWLPEWLRMFFQGSTEEETTKTVAMLIRFSKKWLQRTWSWFVSTASAQLKVEEYIKTFLTYLLQNEYKVVGDIVKTTLNHFSDERLVEFIESKVDTDLQRIRLNGALIGAILGALIYGFLYGIYEPILRLF